MSVILSIIISVIATWFFAHVYYKAGGKQNIELRKALSDDVKKIILNSKKQNLTVKELNRLLEQKTFDKNSNDPLPYLACPKCGNKNLNKSSHTDESSIYYFVECIKCGWSEYTE